MTRKSKESIGLPWSDPRSEPYADVQDVLEIAGRANMKTPHTAVWPVAQYIKLPQARYVPPYVGQNSDGVAIVSGGLDSITTVYHLVNNDYSPHLLSFDYGQRHKKELDYALACAERLSLRWSLIDLSSLTDLISNSALTSDTTLYLPEGEHRPDIEVPEGHYSEDNMAITVVPNRNMMMLSIAGAVAVNFKYQYIAVGVHAGDHAQYPDCRPEFLSDFAHTLLTGNQGFIQRNFKIIAPWIYKTKNDIAQAAFELGVPLNQAWSCYKGGYVHCGRCATCVERLEAVASVKEAPEGWDQTIYEDTEYWKQVVRDWHDQHST